MSRARQEGPPEGDPSRSPGRIDTHFHVVPPAYREWLHHHPGYPGPFVDWSREAALDYMGRSGIAAGILSVSTPGARISASDQIGEVRQVARTVNEFCADLVRGDPAHFGFFATLTLPDLDGCLAEAEYAFDQLNADGVVLMTSTDGVYLGDPRWDPLLGFLNERRAVIFVHPTAPKAPPLPGVSPGVVDFLGDSVRSAINLTKHRCLSRFADLKVLLSHGGGYLPYAALRIARMALADQPQATALAQLRSFYFDTAVTAGPYALPALLSFAHATHVVFGSDWPYAATQQALAFTEGLDSYSLTAAQRYAINRGNAELLFPRLVVRHRTGTG
jgi:6-methylsalicylate decarboxylase